MATITGIIERIKFRNEENGYTVLAVTDNADGDEVVMVGTFAYVSEGDMIEASGRRHAASGVPGRRQGRDPCLSVQQRQQLGAVFADHGAAGLQDAALRQICNFRDTRPGCKFCPFRDAWFSDAALYDAGTGYIRTGCRSAPQ